MIKHKFNKGDYISRKRRYHNCDELWKIGKIIDDNAYNMICIKYGYGYSSYFMEGGIYPFTIEYIDALYNKVDNAKALAILL